MAGRHFSMTEYFVRRCLISGLVVWGLAWSLGGCGRREGGASADGEQAESPPATPLAVARTLRAWHQDRRYRLLERNVAPEQRVLLVDTLMAFNRLAAANERAQSRLIELGYDREAREFDLSGLDGHLGLFSRSARFCNERIDGDRAVVSAQALNQVALEEFRFARRDGRWVYVPDAPMPSLPALVRELAEGMEQFARQIEHPKPTAKEIRSEFVHRVVRSMRSIRRALPTSSPTTSSKPSSLP